MEEWVMCYKLKILLGGGNEGSKSVPKIKTLFPLKTFRGHNWVGSHIQSGI